MLALRAPDTIAELPAALTQLAALQAAVAARLASVPPSPPPAARDAEVYRETRRRSSWIAVLLAADLERLRMLDDRRVNETSIRRRRGMSDIGLDFVVSR